MVSLCDSQAGRLMTKDVGSVTDRFGYCHHGDIEKRITVRLADLLRREENISRTETLVVKKGVISLRTAMDFREILCTFAGTNNDHHA